MKRPSSRENLFRAFAMTLFALITVVLFVEFSFRFHDLTNARIEVRFGSEGPSAKKAKPEKTAGRVYYLPSPLGWGGGSPWPAAVLTMAAAGGYLYLRRKRPQNSDQQSLE